MKNLHLLPTEKPSRLYFHKLAQNFQFSDLPMVNVGSSTWVDLKNIYITSDEEIKEGDWYISLLENEVYKATKETQNIISVVNLVASTSYKKTHFKIILTDNQDLIKDGVQAIDDEFLEWFVNNPSCEWVDIKKLLYKVGSNYQGNRFDGYKIIIPKEEPKQETLEEAIKQELENHFFSNISEIKQAEYFINFGAKWQQEQDKNNYSDREVLPLLEMLEKCKEYFLLKTDAKSEERADAIGQAIEDFNKIKNK
jgi:transcriptional regulator of heat shock response